jgi:hypothetical protein
VRTIALLTAALALSSSACYRMHLRNGDAPIGRAPIEHDEKWHSGLVYGIAELSGPYDLKRVCPGGWSQVSTHTSFLNGLAGGVTYGIYSPQTVTIQCAPKQ